MKTKKTIQDQAKFYDDHDATEVGDTTHAVIRGERLKKINIGIPQSIYTAAIDISHISGTGYQNVLKMAMAIGLNELSAKVHTPRVEK